jgi:hypothetical protein
MVASRDLTVCSQGVSQGDFSLQRRRCYRFAVIISMAKGHLRAGRNVLLFRSYLASLQCRASTDLARVCKITAGFSKL